MRAMLKLRAANLWAYLFLLIFPVFFGITIALLETYAAIFWALILVPIILFLVLRSSPKQHSGKVFIFGFMLFFMLPFISKLTGIVLVGTWQLLFALSIFGFANFYRYLDKAFFVKLSVFFFLGFMGIAFMSTALGRSNFMATAYQFVSDLKPMLLLVMGFAIDWNDDTEKNFWKIIEWFWLPALILVAFEWAAPSVYFKVFKGVAAVPSDGLFPSRAVGPFLNSSILAASGVMFALLIFSRIQTQCFNKNRSHDWFRLVMYVVVVITALQRFELLGLFVSLALIYLIAEPSKLVIRSIFSSVILMIVLGLVWSVFGEEFKREIAQMGFGNFNTIETARVQIYQGAIALAEQYFPLGSGLGTYGGAGAQKFDQSFYYQLGFANYWWFGKESYLMDTYWANSVAETGVFGAIMLLLSYITLAVHSLIKAIKVRGKAQVYWGFSAVGIIYLLMLSLSSPSFQDPMLAFLPLLAIGIASTCEAKAAELT